MNFFRMTIFTFSLNCIAIIILFLINPIISIMYLGVFVVYLYLIKEKRYARLSGEHWSKSVFIAPVSGTIKAVNRHENENEFVIKVRPWDNYGVYFPLKGRLSSFRKVGRGHYLFEFEGDKGTAKMTLKKLWNSFSSLNLYIDIGDLGHIGACIGYLLGGCEARIFLPLEYETYLDYGTNVEAARSVLAQLEAN